MTNTMHWPSSVAVFTLISLVVAASAASSPLAQGIVVPKRSALIMGLNQQFKLKPANQSNLVGFNWLAQRTQVGQTSLQQQQQQQPARQQQQALYLDRHQQEILAANPNLLNPSSLPSALLTRSDAPQNGQRPRGWLQTEGLLYPNGNGTLNGTLAGRLDASASGNFNGNQQSSYRGFSLIELEVKSDPDKRFIQELYGNLSAALNDQARELAKSGPTGSPLTVSPYVDVDFWSFKSLAPNDQIDIMVSPKSRSFILNQLNRAKIRHRIKIDDIQAKLDAQTVSPNGNANQQQQSMTTSGLNQAANLRWAESSSQQLSGRLGVQTNPTQTADSLKARDLEGSGQLKQKDGQKALNDSQFFENYQRLADISQYIESIVERNRDIARVKVIGRSSQGRYLRVLKLGYDDSASEQDATLTRRSSVTLDEPEGQQAEGRAIARAPEQINNATFILDSFFKQHESVRHLGSIWLDGGTHAREWISPSTVVYLAHRLADNHNRCVRFFDRLRQQVAAHEAYLKDKLERQARRVRASPLASSLDADLVNGINEINTSLLGKPAKPTRARTQAELMLERLARNPQELAVEQTGCSLELDQLLRKYTFFIMPVLNPDGYEYSHTHNRLWRKTRSVSNHPIYRHFCLGADPNRNYDARHGSSGSSTHPCSQTYAGTVPFTEPETRHQSNFVYANKNNMKMYISFHSYSQMILLPFSHTRMAAPDHKDLDSVGQAAAKAIEQTHGVVYRVGPSASILYTASGTASDWAYEKAGIKYSYTIELRDNGSYGFLLPKQQILPTGEETFNGLLAMIDQMEKNENVLITSKSSSASSLLLATSNQMGLSNITGSTTDTIDYSHVPDPDKLRPFSRQHPRPPLENVLDGWNGWPESEPAPDGVRDRRPPSDEQPQSLSAGDPLEPTEFDPDSGYSFEGEGELMEPTREQIVEAVKFGRIDQLQMSGRQDHSRRIAQSVSTSSGGRNFINSPLLSSRTSPSPIRRESSEDLAANGNY